MSIGIMFARSKVARSLLIAICVFYAGCSDNDKSQTPIHYDLIIRADFAFDGIATVWSPALVGVIGGEIQYAGEDLPDVTADTELNVGEATILPGFVDAHVHLGEPSRHESSAKTILSQGITAVRDLGGELNSLV